MGVGMYGLRGGKIIWKYGEVLFKFIDNKFTISNSRVPEGTTNSFFSILAAQ